MAGDDFLVVKVTGVSDMSRRIKNIRDGLPRTYRKELLGPFMIQRLQQRFIRGVDADGIAWKPLSPNTAKGIGILRKSQSLMRNIAVVDSSEFGVSGNTGAGFRIGVRSAPREIYRPRSGNTDTVDPAQYGTFHQLGGGRVPKRAFLGWSKSDIESVVRKIRRELVYLQQ